MTTKSTDSIISELPELPLLAAICTSEYQLVAFQGEEALMLWTGEVAANKLSILLPKHQPSVESKELILWAIISLTNSKSKLKMEITVDAYLTASRVIDIVITCVKEWQLEVATQEAADHESNGLKLH